MNDSTKDIKWLIVGLLMGLVLAPLLFIAGMYFYKSQKEKEVQPEAFIERSEIPVTEAVSHVTTYPANTSHTSQNMYQWLFDEEMQHVPMAFQKAIVKTFQENEYFKGSLYDFLDSPVAHVLTYGDFDNDTRQDMACLFEKKDSGNAVLALFTYAHSRQAPSLGYYKHLTDIPVIQTVKKGQPVFLNSKFTHPAPTDGLLIDYVYQKDLLLFHAKSGSYRVYDQRPTDLYAPKKDKPEKAPMQEDQWIEHEEELIQDEQ